MSRNTPQFPSRIGLYHVLGELGRGGMGIVYEAMHEHLQRRVAIKILLPELAADPQNVARFVREGRAACNIRHPHVIDVFELGFEGPAPYLVMDYLSGITLAEHLQQVSRMSLVETLSVLLPVIAGVAAANAAGVVHRDLKPANIMLARDRGGRIQPKVLDFGISKLVAHDVRSLTSSFAVFGTPYYMSPEQLRGSRFCDARSDQYALGVVLYEAATGRRPFDASDYYELIHAIMTAPVIPPSAHQADLPAHFDAIVLRALSRTPEQRFESTTELGAQLVGISPEPLAGLWRAELGDRRQLGAVTTHRAALSAPTLRDDLQPMAASKVRASAWRKWGLALGLASAGWLTSTFWPQGSAAPSTGASAADTESRSERAAALPVVPEPSRSPVATATDAVGHVAVSGDVDASVAVSAPAEPPASPPLAPAASSAKTNVPTARHRSAPPASQSRDHVLLGENGAPILE